MPLLGEPADALNAGIYWYEGDNVNAAASLASTIPILGNVATLGKAAKKATGAVTDATGQVAKHADDVAEAGKNAAKKEKPLQNHHYATNKNLQYTNSMQEVADKYNLKLDGDWNKELLPHLGRHTDAYHEEVLRRMRIADYEAKGDTKKFLKFYEEYVKKWVRNNPEVTQMNPKR